MKKLPGLSPEFIAYHPRGPVRLPNNEQHSMHPGSVRLSTSNKKYHPEGPHKSTLRQGVLSCVLYGDIT